MTDDASEIDAILQQGPTEPGLPIDTRDQLLPIDKLGWENAELLFLKLLVLIPGVRWAKRYGVQGQAQGGIDAYAQRPVDSIRGGTGGREYIALQSRRVASLRPSDVERAVDDFLNGDWADRVSAFYFATSFSLRDVKLDAEIRRQAERLAKHGIEFVPWGAEEVSSLLKAHPIIVEDFFGRPWVKRFCGVEPGHGRGLPGGTREFTARREAVAKLAEQIESHNPAGTEVAILAVDGMAGVGKTALAVHVAHQYKHRYPDGQYFLDLHGYTQGIGPMSPNAALEELLRQAGVPTTGDVAVRQNRWQATMAGKQALVLLDNAQDVPQLQPLLPMSSGCLVLITSRTRLVGLRPYVKNLSLNVLASDEAVELLARLVGSDRCPDPAEAAELVRLVGHLPLAIEMLAGALSGDPGLTVAQLAAELTRARALLNKTSPQGTGVRAAFAISMERLSPNDQRAFAALGLYPRPVIGVPQFGALVGPLIPGLDPGAVLENLSYRNLIKPYQDHTGHPHYEIHDLMRAFAREQAESSLPGEDDAALGRLSAWYVTALRTIHYLRETATAEDAPALDGLHLKNAGEAEAWLDAELGNFIALAITLTSPDTADMCMGYGHYRIRYTDNSAQAFFWEAMYIYSEIGDADSAEIAREHAKSEHQGRTRNMPLTMLEGGRGQRKRGS